MEGSDGSGKASKSVVGFLRDHAQFPDILHLQQRVVRVAISRVQGSDSQIQKFHSSHWSCRVHSTPLCLLADLKWSLRRSLPGSESLAQGGEGEGEKEERMATATAEGVGSFGNSKSKRGLARGSMQPCLQGYSWIELSVLRFTQPFVQDI